MSKICQSFAWYLPHIWLRFTWYLSEIWMRFAWNFPGICCKLRGPIWVFLIFFLKKKSSNWLGNLNDFTYPYSLQIYKVLGLVLGMWFCQEKFAMQADMTKKKNTKRSRQHARIHWRLSSTEDHLPPTITPWLILYLWKQSTYQISACYLAWKWPRSFLDKQTKQAGADLGQAQLKLKLKLLL